MITKAGELIDRTKQSVLNYGAGPQTRIIMREGDFGPERELEHVKVRLDRRGYPEIILQAKVEPIQ